MLKLQFKFGFRVGFRIGLFISTTLLFAAHAADFEIGEFRAGDLDTLVDMTRSSEEIGGEAEKLKIIARMPDVKIHVARATKPPHEILGFIVSRPTVGYIDLIGVHKKARRLGIGSALMEAATANSSSETISWHTSGFNVTMDAMMEKGVQSGAIQKGIFDLDAGVPHRAKRDQLLKYFQKHRAERDGKEPDSPKPRQKLTSSEKAVAKESSSGAKRHDAHAEKF